MASPASAYTINTTEVGKRIRWANDTVSLQLDPALAKFLPDDQARSAIEMSFEAWRGLPRVPDLVLAPGAPVKKPGASGDSPTNGVYLVKHWPYEPEKLAITVITYEMETGRLIDADILVNGQTKFAVLDELKPQRTDQYDFEAVLTHESGHVLGLGESKADPDATMWPYAVPGETQKRTLAQDDEDGVIESYLSKPPAAAGGCGPASVAGKRASHASIVVFMAALVLLAAGSRRRRAALAMLPVLGLTLIVGFGTPRATSDASTQLREQLRAQNDASSADTAAMLRAALRSAEPETRLEAVESLARIGTRDDMALAEELSSDADERIAARAHSALRMLAARAPRASLDARTPEAQARLSRMFDRASRVIAGRAHLTQVIDDDGLLYTEYSVRADDGRETTLRIAGGVRGTIGQRALDGELPPADAQSVVVAEQTDGSVRWAYQQSGRVFGGDLGDGPAIAGAL